MPLFKVTHLSYVSADCLQFYRHSSYTFNTFNTSSRIKKCYAIVDHQRSLVSFFHSEPLSNLQPNLSDFFTSTNIFQIANLLVHHVCALKTAAKGLKKVHVTRKQKLVIASKGITLRLGTPRIHAKKQKVGNQSRPISLFT